MTGRPLPLILVAVLAACATPSTRVPAPPVTPPSERAHAPVVRHALPEPSAPSAERPVEPAPAAVVVPDGAIYVCIVERDGTRAQTVIEFVPKVHDLCRRHPEMGPCQYERNACRAAGGRVFAAGGREITLQTEAEYDRKVTRVRFRAN